MFALQSWAILRFALEVIGIEPSQVQKAGLAEGFRMFSGMSFHDAVVVSSGLLVKRSARGLDVKRGGKPMKPRGGGDP